MKYQFIVFKAIILTLFLALHAHAATNTPPKILILNSYHPGYKWSDDITTGIIDVLSDKYPEAVRNIEYMDTKHFPDDTYIIQLFALYKQKYAHKKFDVIISSDDNAFNFLNYYSEYIFPDTPVVFCGVNYYKPEDISGLPLFTGVNEEADLKAGIEIALKVFSANRDKIDLVLLDLSMPGIGGIKCLEKMIQLDPNIQVIIASGYSSKVAIKDSIKFGAKDYIIKPYTKKELAGVIRNVLNNG